MLRPCRDCADKGKCDIQTEKERLALFAWVHGGLVECSLRTEESWHGVEGVSA